MTRATLSIPDIRPTQIEGDQFLLTQTDLNAQRETPGVIFEWFCTDFQTLSRNQQIGDFMNWSLQFIPV